MSASRRKPQTGIGPEATVPALPHEEIERRACRIFRERGGEQGHDLEHWLQAEKELLDELERAPERRARA